MLQDNRAKSFFTSSPVDLRHHDPENAKRYGLGVKKFVNWKDKAYKFEEVDIYGDDSMEEDHSEYKFRDAPANAPAYVPRRWSEPPLDLRHQLGGKVQDDAAYIINTFIESFADLSIADEQQGLERHGKFTTSRNWKTKSRAKIRRSDQVLILHRPIHRVFQSKEDLKRWKAQTQIKQAMTPVIKASHVGDAAIY